MRIHLILPPRYSAVDRYPHCLSGGFDQMRSPQNVSKSRHRDRLSARLIGGLTVLILAAAACCPAQDDEDDPNAILENLDLAIERHPDRAEGYVRRGEFLRDAGEDGR